MPARFTLILSLAFRRDLEHLPPRAHHEVLEALKLLKTAAKGRTPRSRSSKARGSASGAWSSGRTGSATTWSATRFTCTASGTGERSMASEGRSGAKPKADTLEITERAWGGRYGLEWHVERGRTIERQTTDEPLRSRPDRPSHS